MDREKARVCAMRLTETRRKLLESHPFFGRLLIHLSFGFADCGTACTDMKRIIFDPAFAERLSDDELTFVVLHELMHCVLRHCVRGSGKFSEIYNIACDIVINSIICEAMGVDEFKVDGAVAMHLVPGGKEGRAYTADEVYNMLIKKAEGDMFKIPGNGWNDNHETWEDAMKDDLTQAIWGSIIREELKRSGKSAGNIPAGLRRHLPDTSYSGRIAWEQVLHDFIRFDRSDFIFEKPDNRYDCDFVIPSFCEDIYGMCVDRVWFVVDTSGSVSDELLAAVYEELKNVVNRIDSVNGELSFFDCEVTEPKPFSDVTELMGIRPVGGGGTSFEVIFDFMKKHFDEKLRAIIIMTDGYAAFPDEEAAEGIPVIWVIADSDIEPPWGECIHINSI